MGISYAAAQFLVDARNSGASFDRTLTLGRQDLFASPILLTRLLKREGFLSDPSGFRRAITRWPYRADPLFEALGARELHFMDNSPYEGANLIHDLNEPIPEAFKEKYDLVLDGGTLEHIFNFPVALKNAMEMVRVGGNAIFLSPANNYVGHGFYQLSPELYLQALSEQNGYRIERLLAIEDDLATDWIFGRIPIAVEAQRGAYEIPRDLPTGRIEFTTTRPALLFVLASRQERVQIFSTTPQQGLYRTLWEGDSEDGEAPAPASASLNRSLTPRGPAASLGLGAALHLVFGGLGRMLRPIRNLALARHYRSRRLKRQGPDIKRSDLIRR
jgi:hypothetical protein